MSTPLTQAPSTVPLPDWIKAANAAVNDSLRPVAGGLAILYGILTMTHLLAVDNPLLAQVMTVIAGGTALMNVAFYLGLARRKAPPQWAHPIAGLMAGGVLVNSLAHLFISQEPRQTTNLVLLIVGVGFFFLSTRWLLAFMALIVGGWLAAITLLPPSPDWFHFGFALFSGAVLSILVFTVRINTLKRLELLHLQDQYYRQELEAVLKSTEEAQRSLATSMAVGQRITSILDLNTLLIQVSGLIQARFNLYAVCIFLLEEQGRVAALRAGAGKNGRPLNQPDFRLPVNDLSVVGWTAARRRPLNVENVKNEKRYIAVEWLAEAQSELALPLEFGGHLLGVLDLQSAHVGAFHDEIVPFLQLLADQVAIAINNASLYESEKRRVRLTENLYSVGRAISSTLDRTEVLNLILDHLSELVPFDRAGLMLRVGEELEIAAQRGFPSGQQRLRVPIKSNDVFEEIYHTHQPLAIDDVSSSRPDWTNVEGLPTTRAWLGIPLLHSGEVIGMLSLARLEVEPYSKEEITLAGTFAGQAAIALRNASLYDEIARFNQDLEKLVQQRTEDLQKAYAQLAQLDKAKSDFIGVASHELRTPLTVVQGYSQMLREDPLIKAEARYEMLVKGILSGVQRLLEIIESMLDVAKIDNRELMLYPTPVPVPTMIQNVVESLQSAIDERKMQVALNIAGLPSIQADVDALRKVFYQLIINAIKFTPDGGKINITGREMPAGSFGIAQPTIEVVVADQGIGIDRGNLELIFNKFYSTDKISLHSTGKTKFKGKGPGLGLSIAKGIVEAHGGKIWVESAGYNEETLPGSEFHVVLPQRQG